MTLSPDDIAPVTTLDKKKICNGAWAPKLIAGALRSFSLRKIPVFASVGFNGLKGKQSLTAQASPGSAW